MRRPSTLLILALALLLGGCATTRTRQLGDGTRQPLAYTDAGPAWASNDWAEVTRADTAFAAEPDPQFDLPFWWEFGLRSKNGDLRSVQVYDVTVAPPRLLLADPVVTLHDGEWRGRTAPEKFSRAAAPWFYEPGESEHVFKLVLTDSANRERSLYQPCRHRPEAKKARVLEVLRLTAPEIKPKSRPASAPSPNPTQFSVSLAKKKPTDKLRLAPGTAPNTMLLGITNKPSPNYDAKPGN